MKRIDVELVKRGLFETRSKAQFAIKSGVVYCNGNKIVKNNYCVEHTDILEVRSIVLPYVSKGGLKLEKAINDFHIDLNEKKMIDIGASTGGFTDCAIQNGVGKVLAIDVGTLQFSKKLLITGKVDLLENTDFRELKPSILSDYDIATIDISFISIKKIIPQLSKLSHLKEIVLLIKPQFECGINLAKKYKGVVLNKSVHVDILNNTIKTFNNIGFGLNGLTYSPIRGGSGNIEYLSYFKKDSYNIEIDVNNVVNEGFINLIKRGV